MRFGSVILAATLIAASATTPATAQALQPAIQAAPGNTLLTVSAEGKSFREPDVAVFSAGVTTQGKTAAAALAENSRAMTQVIAALKRAGIAERDIQTSNLSISPVYTDPNREAMIAAQTRGQPYVPLPPEQQVPKIVGYNASNNVSVRQRDIGNFGKVIDTLAAAGANQINGPMFQMDDQAPALDEARLEAIKTARARAELYAGATGLRIVRILSISEGGGYYNPTPIFVTASRIAGPAAPPPPPPAPVQPGELQMTANVTVLYELAPR